LRLQVQDKFVDLPAIGSPAPFFEAVSVSGSISFPDQFLGSWVILFGHMPEFSPQTEQDLLLLRSIGEQYKKLDCRLVDVFPGDTNAYIQSFYDIKAKYMPYGLDGFEKQFSVVDDRAHHVSLLYGISPLDELASDEVIGFFVIDPQGLVRTIIMHHPDDVKRIFDGLLRVVIALRSSDALFSSEKKLHVLNRVAMPL